MAKTAISAEPEFFASHWRKQFCWFPGAAKELPRLSWEALLAYASNDLVESRLIDENCSVGSGPFDLGGQLPAGAMLMLNGLEQHTSEFDAMLRTDFGFLPRWRVDDVMATMANIGANCGAHFDRYDVFLVQLTGDKTWHLDAGDHTEDDLDPSADLRLLRSFSPETTLTAKPGDILYIPPGLGHWGVAGNQSVTLSVGIRNPTVTEFLAEMTDHLLVTDDAGQALDDAMQTAGSGISMEDVQHLGVRLGSLLNDPVLLADTYGEYVTRPREPELLSPAGYSPGAGEIALSPGARLSWTEIDGQVRVYANGETILTIPSVLGWLAGLERERRWSFAAAPSADDARLLTALAETGALFSDL